eukprot:5196360-Ditylum_brightwellii.AAC.1
MQAILSPISEHDYNLVEDAVIEASNHTVIIPTQVTKRFLSQNGDSSSVVTTLTNQVTTTMLQTSVIVHILELEAPLMMIYCPPNVPTPLREIQVMMCLKF